MFGLQRILLTIIGCFEMKTRNAFATLMICIVLALTIAAVVNVDKASAQSIAECRKSVTGTYLYTTNSGNLGSFRGILTLTQDGNAISTASIQGTGAPPLPSPLASNRAVGSVPQTERLLPRYSTSITQQRQYLAQLPEVIPVRKLIQKLGQYKEQLQGGRLL